MEIRSFRRVFDLERRVYSVDRLRLNPSGVPVRGIVYFVLLLVFSLIFARMPVVGVLDRMVPWYLGDLALPLGLATLLSVIRVEGRTFHLSAGALLRHIAAPRGLCGLSRPGRVGERWHPDQIVILPDGSDNRMRRLSYCGPGAVLVVLAHELARDHGPIGMGLRRARMKLRERPGGDVLGEGKVIALASGAELLVRASRDGGR